MSGKKLKEWKVAVEERLAALENILRNRSSKPQDIKNKLELEESGQPVSMAGGPSKTSRIWPVLKWTGISLTWFGFFLGVVTGYLSLVPRISVVQSQPLDSSDPFSTPFILSDDGPLGINDIKTFCGILDIEANPRISVSGGMSVVGPVNAAMDPGERASIPCLFEGAFKLAGPITKADITIRIEFRPDFVPRRQPRSFRFVAQKASDGNFYWFSQPIPRLQEK